MTIAVALCLVMWGGATLMLYTDVTEHKVYLWNFIIYIILLVLCKIPILPFNLVSTNIFYNYLDKNYIFKILTILLYLIILLPSIIKHKIAIADVLLIIVIFILFPIKFSLYILIVSTLLGLLLAFITKSRNIGFVGILSWVVATALFLMRLL